LTGQSPSGDSTTDHEQRVRRSGDYLWVCNNASMRSLVGGWLLNSPSRPPSEGLMMNRCAVAGFASSGTARDAESIFCRAAANAGGDPTRAAPAASASYSRDREMAI